MENSDRVIQSVLPMLSESDKADIATKCLEKVDHLFGEFGYSVVRKQIIPPQSKKTDRKFTVNDRTFPTKKAAAEYYGVNYQTAVGKLSSGVPAEEIFIEKQPKQAQVVRKQH